MAERRVFYQPVLFNEGVTFGTSTGAISYGDGVKFQLGTDGDYALVERATVLNANTTLAGVIVGTPVTPAVAANSLLIGGITADGDVMMATQTGGNSHAFLWYDTSAAILRLYSGAGVEVAKFDSAAITLTGLTTLAGGWRTSGASHVGFGAGEAVTIVSGVATVTKPWVILDAEGAGTTDTLDSITYSGQAAGDLLLLTVTATDTITADNSATLLLGAATRAIAPGGSLLLLATSATIWQELHFLAASS
jgi:hypothetical protein